MRARPLCVQKRLHTLANHAAIDLVGESGWSCCPGYLANAREWNASKSRPRR
jgi:hypothetical protein